jgi:ubiquinone biosynthesis protein
MAMISELLRIDPRELVAVVPDCYAAFRPLVADCLGFFLQHLSPPRLAEIVHDQTLLPADTPVARRLVVFLHACPVLHKFGQVLARHRQLDPELRRHLQELEMLEPHTPMESLRPVLHRELSPAAEKYRLQVAEEPLAEGSVAAVLPLTWADPADGHSAPPRQGVAKVLKPGVIERLDEDLVILGQLVGYVEDRVAAYHLPPLAYRDIFHEVAQLLANEVQLRQEQDHLRLAEEQFAGQPDIHIPGLLPFCTAGLTAMERVHGRKVTDPGAVASWQRPALFRRTVRALLSGVMFSRSGSALFHGDPHAGNLLVDRDGRLGILDWSLAGQLTTADRQHLSQILVGGWARDNERVVRAVACLARPGTDEANLRTLIAAALAKRRFPPGPLWALELLDAIAQTGVRFPPRLLLFRKAFLTLEGVLADLSPRDSLGTALTTDALVQLIWEWPLRLWKSLDDHDYATGVSTADLARAALGACL